jgi:hypothetical protein
MANDGVEVSPDEGGFITSLTEEFAGSRGPDPNPPAGGAPVVELGTVLFDGFCGGANWTGGCDPSDVIPPEATVTPGSVLTAFRSLDLPAAKLVIQPPNGRTLVNFETNFYTEQGSFTRTVTLLGRQVELRIWPAAYDWRFGDGETERTTSPGAAYPDLEVTHTYLEKGRVSPSVDTTYAAQFRVGGGPWQDVSGTVTITGTPEELRVVEARPVLVG